MNFYEHPTRLWRLTWRDRHATSHPVLIELSSLSRHRVDSSHLALNLVPRCSACSRFLEGKQANYYCPGCERTITRSSTFIGVSLILEEEEIAPAAAAYIFPHLDFLGATLMGFDFARSLMASSEHIDRAFFFTLPELEQLATDFYCIR